MTRASSANLMSAEELLERADSIGRCELIRGELSTMSPAGGRHGRIAARLAAILSEYAAESGGAVYGAETGFLLERRPDTVRAPDAAFIASDRAAGADTAKFIEIPPDFCAEVLSPDDRASAVASNVQWWLGHGVRVVWVVDPLNETVTIYERTGGIRLHQRGEAIDSGDELPRFIASVDRIFD